MNILIDLINYPKAGGKSYDWRYTIWIDICEELKRRGHKIWGCPHRVKNMEFPLYKGTTRIFDYYICLSPYGHINRTARYQLHRDHNKPVTCYDHGWLPNSVVVDRKKLFGDSYYYDTISNLIQECPSLEKAEAIRQRMLTGNISKRAQPKKDKIPNVKYILIPGQVLHDASVVHYSDTGLKKLILETLDFAKQHDLHVVYKPHPGLSGAPSHGLQELRNFEKRVSSFTHFHRVNTSIFDLMQAAEFTCCVNSGSIIDNIVSLTPVYCCGNSFFAKSGTVIYDPDVRRGLTKMLSKDYDAKHMKKQQLRMLWWLNKYMIQEKEPVSHKIELLEFHSGIKF